MQPQSAGDAIELDGPAGCKIRELIRSGSFQECSRLFDACNGIAQIVILCEGGSKQLLKLVIFEQFKPFQIGERTGSGLVCGGWWLRRPKR